MSPELETLDQLQGGDLPLDIIRSLFPNDTHFELALVAMVDAGDIRLLDGEGREIALWKISTIVRRGAGHQQNTAYRISMTDSGAAKIE